MKPINREVFRTYDIRGIVDADFDEEWVERLGQACGAYFLQHGSDTAVVGYDARHSSPAYAAAMTRGITSTGVNVVSVGQVASPSFYWSVTKLGHTAGVMITASHNPAEYNGFKVWQGVTTIHSEEIQDVFEIMEKGDFPTGRGSVTQKAMLADYVAELAADVTLKRPLKVVVDGGNGAGGELTAEALEKAGAEVVRLYCEPDGDFPNHHPDPVVEKNMVALKEAVVVEKADFGVGLDGDGDRIGIVTEKGDLLFGDQLVAIYARDILKDFPGAAIIGEVKCSHLMYEDIKKHGGDAVMWKTGHSLIKARMKEIDAKFAGEMSGHMFFADRYYGFDDATYAALRMAEIVGGSEMTMSDHLKDWPKTYSTPEIRFECPEKLKGEVVKKAVEYFGSRFDAIDIDGVRAIFPDGWGLLRASNTQPVLVLRFEAETPERLAEIKGMFDEKLAEWIPQ